MVKEKRLPTTIRHEPNVASFFGQAVPAIIAAEGPDAVRRFIEFFTACIRNRNTRAAYAQNVSQFCRWCNNRRFKLGTIEPTTVAAYIEELEKHRSKSTVKQHLAALRVLFDWLVLGHVLCSNPSSSVRGPRHVVKKGKTPVLTAEEARMLLDSIPITRSIRRHGRKLLVPDVVGLRDRALISIMIFSFARVSAAIGMNTDDYLAAPRHSSVRLHEKGGKTIEMPAHPVIEQFMEEYLEIAGSGTGEKYPLFRSAAGRTKCLTENRMSRTDAFRMIKRRASVAGLKASTRCHSFRATGITTFIKNGGTLEKAQSMAGHESPRTTKLYDRTSDDITLDEVKRIRI